MYDWEIAKILCDNKYNLDSKTYLYICNTSPQITHIKYNTFINQFDISTNENNWAFTVHPS